MKYRKLHIEGEVWEYRIGKRFIDIKSPAGSRTQVEKPDIFMDDEGTAKKRAAGDAEWSQYAWDKSVVPSDFGIELISTFTPSVVKTYIEAKLIKE